MSFSTPAKALAAVRFLPPWYRRCLPSCTNAFCCVGGVPTGRLLMTCVAEEQKRDARHSQLAQREKKEGDVARVLGVTHEAIQLVGGHKSRQEAECGEQTAP